MSRAWIGIEPSTLGKLFVDGSTSKATIHIPAIFRGRFTSLLRANNLTAVVSPQEVVDSHWLSGVAKLTAPDSGDVANCICIGTLTVR